MENRLIKMGLVVIIILLVIIAISGYNYYKIHIIGNIEFEDIDKSDENLGIVKGEKPKTPQVNQKDKTKEEVESVKENKIYRVLLLGVDSRGRNDRGRSDAIMVVTIDVNNKKIKLASFLRDLQLDINGRPDKLNHAYAYEGGVGVLRTLNSNLGVDLKEYITVNMFNLRQVIDKVGKIEVDIKKNEIKEINYRIKEAADLEGWKGYKLLEQSGVQEINGEQAVAYMRIRNTGSGDIDRTGRQREVLELLLKEVSKNNLVEVMGLAPEVTKLVSTSMEVSDLEKLVIDVLPILADLEIESMVFPSDNMAYSDMSTGVYYWKLRDKEEFTTDVQNFLGYNNLN